MIGAKGDQHSGKTGNRQKAHHHQDNQAPIATFGHEKPHNKPYFGQAREL
jgi:hypothetical protein